MGRDSTIAKLTVKLGHAPTEAQIQDYKAKKAAKKAAEALATEAAAAPPPTPAAPAAKPSKEERKIAKSAAAAAAAAASSSAATPPPAKKQKTAATASAATSPSGALKRAPSPYNLYMKAELPRLKIAEPSLTHKEAFSKVGESWKASEQNPKNGGTALAEQAKAAKAAFDAAKATPTATAATPGAIDAAPTKKRKSATTNAAANAAAVATECTQLCCDTLEEVLRATAPQADGTAIVDALREALAADASGFEVRTLAHLPLRVDLPSLARSSPPAHRRPHRRPHRRQHRRQRVAARIRTHRLLAPTCTQVAYAKAHGLKPPKVKKVKKPKVKKVPKEKVPKEPRGPKVNQEVLAKALKLMRRYRWDIFDAMAGGKVRACTILPARTFVALARSADVDTPRSLARRMGSRSFSWNTSNSSPSTRACTPRGTSASNLSGRSVRTASSTPTPAWLRPRLTMMMRRRRW